MQSMHIHFRHAAAVLSILFALAGLTACGGGDSSSSGSDSAAVSGVATPSSISVVSAKNAD